MAKRITPLSELFKESPSAKLRFGIVFWVACLAILGAVSWAYSNHFDNEFEFDDTHCIVRNSALDTMDIGAFMSDPGTYSTLPANQAWRPGITILNSIDTIRSGGTPDPVKFHQHIFAFYILLGVLVFFMIFHLLRKAFPQITYTHYVALFCTGFFLLHTANAETINYIIARSDSQSTFFIVLAMVLFQYSEVSRKYFLYVIPMALGFLIKESAIMFAPILLVYCWLFTDSFRKHFTGLAITFGAAVVLYLISRAKTPETWVAGGDNPFLYLCTQAWVVLNYFFTFILPVHLTADSDMALIQNPLDTRVMIGAIFIAVLIYFAIRCSRKPETRLVTFGIAWFFFALAPTSSIVPFAEVMNDHRIFFPFIGLIIASGNGVVLLIQRMQEYTMVKPMLTTLGGVLLIAHAYGTHQRCEVWNTNESLWKDVTEKSPDNARGWMNYGLAFMEKDSPGALDTAIMLFRKSESLAPNYTYVHINLGIAEAKLGNNAVAEGHYKYALALDSINPEAYYYYGDWLIKMERMKEGIALLNKGHEKSPGHSGINALLAMWSSGVPMTPLQQAIEAADKNPTPENLVTLSLAWYQAGEYLQCAKTAEKATELKPDYGVAWNNICAAYNKIGEFEKAIAAGQRAVALLPQDQLSKNNLAAAETQKKHFDGLMADATSAPTADKWLNLSLEWYTAGNYAKCIDAAEKVIELDPDNAGAWNNICAAANKLGDWEKGITAGEKAVALDPKSELAKNNLKESQRLRDAVQK